MMIPRKGDNLDQKVCDCCGWDCQLDRKEEIWDDASKTEILWTGTPMQVRNARANDSIVSESTQARRGMILPFQLLSLAFNHVNYYVDMPAVSPLLPNLRLPKFRAAMK